LGGHSLYNADQVRGILDGYRNVVLWLNGHNHAGDYKLMGTRHHLNLKGMQESATAWYEIAFSQDRAKVYQAGNTITPVYDLDIERPSPAVASPSGFAVSEGAGSPTLTWDAEPAGVTGVIIEARQVSSAQPWQVLATIPAPSGGTYADTIPGPPGEFRYRIRFQAGQDFSRYSQALGAGESAGLSYTKFVASLGPDSESPFDDADGDGKPNVIEHFYGTRMLQPDADPQRELAISRSEDGGVRLMFSHDSSSIHGWDVAMSTDLGHWRMLCAGVDYRVVSTEPWTPAGSSGSLTRVVFEPMEHTSRAFAGTDAGLFLRLQVAPAVD
jgi:hypothetical protein